MMDRRRLKDLLMTNPFRGQLDDDRQRLHDKNQPDQGQDKQRISQHRHYRQRAAQSKRPHITHEEASRINIKPQVTDQRSQHGKAEARQPELLVKDSDHSIGKERR